MKNLTQRALHGAGWISGSQGVQAILQLAVIATLARLLEPREFGLMATAMVVIGLAQTFTQIGVGPALVQKKELSQPDINTGFSLGILMGFAVVGLFLLLAPWMAGFFEQDELLPMLKVLAWIFLFKAFAIVPNSLLLRNMQYRQYSLLHLCAYVVGSAATITLALMGAGVWALVYGYCLQAAVYSLILLPYMHGARLGYNSRSAGHIINYGFGLTLAVCFNFIAKNGDYIIVGKLLGPTALGFYSRAYSLMQKVAGIIGAGLNKSLFPVMAGIQDDLPRIARGYRRMVALVALLMIPAGMAAVVLAPEIIHILLGSAWDSVILPFQILMAGLVFRTGYKSSDTLTRATGAVYRRAWRQGIYALLVIIGALAGAHYGGIVGVALGVTLAMAANYIFMAQLCLKIAPVGWGPFLKAHLPGIWVALIVLLATAPMALLMRAHEYHSLTVLFVVTIVSILIVIGFIGLMPSFFLGKDGVYGIKFIRDRYLTKIDISFLVKKKF